MILKGFVYILVILVDHWVSSISTDAMEEFCIGAKNCPQHFYRKTCMGLEWGGYPRCQ